MKKIIIVEDDRGIQDAVGQLFLPPAYEVMIFGDANELLAGKFDVPHLFIIDKQLPGVDGLDLCRHLKQQPLTQQVPVIVMSASTTASKLATLAGAEGFIEKPFMLKRMREVVNGLLG